MLNTNNDTDRFPTYTNKFYPRAEVFTKYIDDVVERNGLNAVFNASVECVSDVRDGGWGDFRGIKVSDEA